MISVCMATYNGSQFVRRQIESILSQLGIDDELIISDDGSVDDTCSIISGFQDGRIQLVTNSGRKGPVGNFQNSMRLASGKFIFLADQDDIWLENKVNITISLLQEHDLVLSDCRVVDDRGIIIHPSFFKHRLSKKGFWYNLYKNSYIGCCMAFRREVLDYVLPLPLNIHMHDWWIGLLVEANGRVVFAHTPLISYVRHGGNASQTGEKGFGLRQKVVNRLQMIISILRRLLKMTINIKK